jgi:hypothetical protein
VKFGSSPLQAGAFIGLPLVYRKAVANLITVHRHAAEMPHGKTAQFDVAGPRSACNSRRIGEFQAINREC